MRNWSRFLAVLIVLVLVFSPVGTVSAAEQPVKYVSYDEAIAAIVNSMEGRTIEAMAYRSISVAFTYEYPHELSTSQIQDLIFAGIEKHTGKPTQGDYLRLCQAFWDIRDITDDFDGTTHRIRIGHISFTFYSDFHRESQVEEKITEILASLDLEGKSERDKIYAIYDYVCRNVAYDFEHIELLETVVWDPNEPSFFTAYSAYGALIEGKTCCQGYTAALYRMLLTAGIDCRVITGGIHAWNIVKVGDLWYYLDSTWDAGLNENYNYFLSGTASFYDRDHVAEDRFFDPAFLAEYPISMTDYGQESQNPTASGSCGSNATWSLTDGTLTVRGTGAVTRTSQWEALRPYIKRAVVESGITALGECAFEGLVALEVVELPDTLKSIGKNAFTGCASLKSVTVPDSVNTIGEAAFRYCSGLESVKLSEAIPEIPIHAFYGCFSLKGITIPASVTKIGEGAFCKAFSTDGTASVTVPATVTEMDGMVFYESNAGSVELMANLETLPAFTFCFADMLKSVRVSDTVTYIGEEAFGGCTLLENVTLPKNLRNGDVEMFINCEFLRSITLPDTMEVIPERMFMGCERLADVKIPEGVTSIGLQAFMECAISQMKIPASVTYLDDYIFQDCKNLTRIIVPATVTKVSALFAGQYPELEAIVFLGDVPEFEGTDGESFPSTVICGRIFYPEGNATWEAFIDPDMDFLFHPGTDHTGGDRWEGDAWEHFRPCTVCGDPMDMGEHTYGEGVREGNMIVYTCVCGAQKEEVAPVVEEAPAPTPPPGAGGDGLDIGLIVGISACTFGAAAVIVILILRRKRKQA